VNSARSDVNKYRRLNWKKENRRNALDAEVKKVMEVSRLNWKKENRGKFQD
jgi:hypothetical protein